MLNRTTAALVQVNNGQPTTTSLDIATYFGKRHDVVLRSIRNLDCSAEFALHNFAECSRTGSNNKPEPFFRMSRDGLTFLCMGFTGKEAAKWKEAYIDAFNQMEQALRVGKSASSTVESITLQRIFRGRSVYFALHEGKPWVSAANVCSALGIGSSDKLLRLIPESQICRLMRGTVSLRMFDLPAALRAADHCSRETADEYRQWLQNAEAELLATAAPQSQRLCGASISTNEQAARAVLSTARFLCSFDFDGKMLMSELPRDAVVIPANKLAGFIGDPAGVPRELLGDILEAVGRRMKALH